MSSDSPDFGSGEINALLDLGASLFGKRERPFEEFAQKLADLVTEALAKKATAEELTVVLLGAAASLAVMKTNLTAHEAQTQLNKSWALAIAAKTGQL